MDEGDTSTASGRLRWHTQPENRRRWSGTRPALRVRLGHNERCGQPKSTRQLQSTSPRPGLPPPDPRRTLYPGRSAFKRAQFIADASSPLIESSPPHSRLIAYVPVCIYGPWAEAQGCAYSSRHRASGTQSPSPRSMTGAVWDCDEFGRMGYARGRAEESRRCGGPMKETFWDLS